MLIAGGVVALAGSPAAAHVTVSPSTTVAGSYTLLTFSVPHGCEGAGTTKVSIQIPKEINAVTPSVNVSWNVEKVMADLNPPVKDSHGNEVTKRVAEVVYTAKTPLPATLRDAFELSLQLPDAAGTTLVFPTVQTCEQGETAWTQVPAAGQKADDLEHPAPAFALTAKPADGADPAAAPVAQNTAAEADNGSDGASPVLSWVALIVGAAGLVVGGLALFRSRKTA
jgi:uncharacterized protein YcnI